ncbi:MAG: hypothetical protein HY300_11565 [Verrucomicrobia bacterium]|nr:hypothetical protein [Verrucomicrobiota bacterium]
MTLGILVHNRQSNDECRAFTRKELLIVIACLLLLVLIFQPAYINARAKAERVHCANYLKQIGLGFRVFADDHNGNYPFAATNSKAIHLAYQNETDAWIHFQVMSNELGTARILTCGMDREQIGNRTDDFAELATRKNKSVSYFVGISASEAHPAGLLAGDRCVWTNRLRLQGKVLLLTPKDALRWDDPFHDRAGNVAFADGSVQLIGLLGSSPAFPLNQSIETNRLLLPLSPSPN